MRANRNFPLKDGLNFTLIVSNILDQQKQNENPQISTFFLLVKRGKQLCFPVFIASGHGR
jgi:hypothetical protein